MRIKIIWLLAILSFYSVLLQACSSSKERKFTSPQGYDLSNPLIIHLKSELDEISGIAYYKKDNSLFAICDEYGVLYKIRLQKPVRIEKWKFSTSGDYEDIALVDSAFYILKSNGEISSVTFSDEMPKVSSVCRINPSGKNEFESLYYDSDVKKLIVLCKDCAEDNNKQSTAYQFDLSTGLFDNKAYYILHHKSKEESEALKKIFKPSATAIHPKTHEVYIISSIARALIVADTLGNVKNIYKLNPKLFKQPEGMTFSPDGTLYISNESAETGSSNILVFKYNNNINEN